MKQPHSIFYPLVIGADHPILRKKSEPIMEFSKEIQDFSDILLALMYEYDGIGLAAPQLGENIRMIAVTHRKEQKWTTKKRQIVEEYVMLNPEIIEHSEQKQVNEEACLSLPKVFGDVERYTRIKVKYFDSHGKWYTRKLQGFSAVVVQHEIDHLDGILFIDKVLGEITH